MMKIKTIASISLFAVLAAVMVYAWAFDTDGGFMPFQKGTCNYRVENTGWQNVTDYCVNNTHLKEFFPTGVNQSQTCNFTYVPCPSYNHLDNATNCWHTYMCSKGQCVEKITGLSEEKLVSMMS